MIRPMQQPVRTSVFLPFILIVVSSAAVSSAQQGNRPQPQATPTQTRTNETKSAPIASDPDVQAADIAIIANIKAESLIFEAVPNPKVEFPGNYQRHTVWEAFRDNLPTPVQPGVTYRNIGIRLRITSVFTDIDRIVSEALGEVPVSPSPTPESQPTQNQTRPSPQPNPTPPPRER